MWTGYKRALYWFALFSERLHRSRFSLAPLIQCKPLHWVWRRTTTADEASPRVEPARSRITGEAEDSTVYKTLLHWHGLAREASTSPQEWKHLNAHAATPPLTPLLSDIVIEIKTSNTVKQKVKITVAYRCRNMKKGVGGEQSKINYMTCVNTWRLEAWLPCQLIPRSTFHPSAKSRYELWRQNKIRETHYRSEKKEKKTLRFPGSLTLEIWMYTLEFPASRLGVTSGIQWTETICVADCRHYQQWRISLSGSKYLFSMQETSEKKTNCLHANRASSLHITVSPKQKKQQQQKNNNNKTTPDV